MENCVDFYHLTAYGNSGLFEVLETSIGLSVRHQILLAFMSVSFLLHCEHYLLNFLVIPVSLSLDCCVQVQNLTGKDKRDFKRKKRILKSHQI